MEQPEKIGKYEVRGKLGEGATSNVWLAWDPFAQRDVAVKVIFPEVLQDKERGRLYRHLLINEASLAGKLMHPHIVQIYDAVVDEEQSYIVMEYVPGGTLEQFCRPDNLLPIDRLVEIVFKCTRALDYAYHLGITHRDIKPANILLASGGDIKISDFGAALHTSGDQTRTQVSGIGSPAYMSPQQVREMPLNHQTDIYSLGVVMYQLLTGRLPFQASNNYSMVYQITHVDPPPPSTFRRDLPENLDAVVARAMQKDLDDRYANWEEFSHDLAQAFRNRQLKERRQQDFADSEKFETLRALPFFADFSDVELWEVVRFSNWDRVSPETVIMKDGEPGDYFCFIAEGELKVAKRGRMLNVLTSGDCFGEMAVIGKTSGGRNADVIAVTDAKIITIRGDALRQSSEACRMHFYSAFLEVLANRLALANARLASV
ncbi:MAG: serine/threonine protein kinase [Rhodocyclaceae bacterium]|jgi:serine/threonine protein kinase|nr:serine/threonine protein kinase [Rhodocyclaceae bacterium]